MDINVINENVQIGRFVKNETFTEIVEGDIIVPDIKPDILKISKVDGNVYISRKDVEEGHLKVDGIVDAYVMYIADNEKNQIKGINSVLNFSENLDMPELKTGMIANVTATINNIEYKIINGRKLSVKYTIDIYISIVENKQIEIIKDIENADCIQKQIETVCFNELVAHGFENVSVKENISIPNANLPIAEIINVFASLEEKDYKVSYNKLLAKCELKLTVVYIADTENGEIESFETKIPVTGFIDLNGINDQMAFDVNCNISYLYIKPVYQDLKATSVLAEAEIEFSALAYDDRKVDIISDLYNPECEVKYEIISHVILQKNKIGSQNVKLEQMVTLPELMNSKILNLEATPVIMDKKFLDDKLMLNGNLEVDILYYNSEKNTLETKMIELPYKETIKLSRKPNEKMTTVNLTTNLIKYTFEVTGQLQIEAEFEINVFETKDININTISNLNQTDEVVVPIASVIIYYVKAGDTLWKIAKEYRSTVESIMKVNNLKDDKIFPGQQLIIPKKVYRVSIDSIN